MTSLDVTAPRFVEMAHRIVWGTAATVDPRGRPSTRVSSPHLGVGWTAAHRVDRDVAGLGEGCTSCRDTIDVGDLLGSHAGHLHRRLRCDMGDRTC